MTINGKLSKMPENLTALKNEKGHLKFNIQIAFLIYSIISSQALLHPQLFEISHPFPL